MKKHQASVGLLQAAADGGHHHSVVSTRLELVEVEAGGLHQDAPAVAFESLQLMVSYLNNAWCQQMSRELRNVQCGHSGVRCGAVSQML